VEIRDRIKELRRVQASQLRPNPRNWRTHSETQRNALQGVLAEIGFAGALLARELADGSLELIDGHLRAKTTPDMAVPVLVLDVNEQEADKILATYDPLSGLAGVDAAALQSLLDGIETDNAALREMWSGLAEQAGDFSEDDPSSPIPVTVPRLFQVVAECRDEPEQQSVYERLVQEGFKCRLLTL
jgi:ParB-like nuclease family protein